MANPIPGWFASYYTTAGEDLTHAGSPPSWARLKINGLTMPGFLEIDVAHALVKWSGKADGKTPGSPTARGREPGRATVKLTITNNREWDDYVALMPRLLPYVKEGCSSSAGAVRVEHPWLAAHYLHHVIISDLKARMPSGGRSGEVVFTFEECRLEKEFKVQSATPKARTGKIDFAPTIDLPGEAPRPPNLRDYARKPSEGAR